MKIVLLGDLHGNMPAVEAMERELDSIRPDDIWFLGDAVGKGPESDKTCDWARTHCNHWIAGNWARGLSSHREDNPFYTQQIGEERFSWLDSLPLEDELKISGIRFRLVHGRFLDPL
jgi:predicted phosphodiesterase